jgi:molecular chaperone DnaK (HSP70)
VRGRPVARRRAPVAGRRTWAANSRLIERNTTIPTKKSQIFSTAEDNQTAVCAVFFRANAKWHPGQSLLGQFDLIGIPRRLAAFRR